MVLFVSDFNKFLDKYSFSLPYSIKKVLFYFRINKKPRVWKKASILPIFHKTFWDFVKKICKKNVIQNKAKNQKFRCLYISKSVIYPIFFLSSPSSLCFSFTFFWKTLREIPSKFQRDFPKIWITQFSLRKNEKMCYSELHLKKSIFNYSIQFT